jgi:glycerol-3-phosphate acyltransferase PlsY
VVWAFWPERVLIGMQLVVTGILFWRHRSNIRNLISGTEERIVAADEQPRD